MNNKNTCRQAGVFHRERTDFAHLLPNSRVAVQIVLPTLELVVYERNPRSYPHETLSRGVPYQFVLTGGVNLSSALRRTRVASLTLGQPMADKIIRLPYK